MKRLSVLLCVALAACSITPQVVPSATYPPYQASQLGAISVTQAVGPPVASPSPAPPAIEEFNFVLLGGDDSAGREASGYRTPATVHTDVFVIAHVAMTDPPVVTFITLPRNLWVHVESFPDMWSMQVYGREGFAGIHYYIQEVFGLPVTAIFYIRMDRFVQLVDSIGGLDVLTVNGSAAMNGDEVLAYLRDNDNNWGCSQYDCEGRIRRVLYAFIEKAPSVLRNMDFLGALSALYGLYETDISAFQQLEWVYNLARLLITSPIDLRYAPLWSPAIITGDTPLNVRGMVPTRSLVSWMQETLRP